jgi:LPXTG-motif cell wall-anchored protein
MTRTNLRKLLAMPAVLALAAGGVLLGAVPAQAAPGTLVVLTPIDGSTATSRAVEVSGTGSVGAGVAAANADSSVIGATVVDALGTWTITLAFTDAAAASQTITVNQVLPPDLDPDAAVIAITLPAVVPSVPSGPIVVDEPADGATFATRTVTFTGSAPVGSSLTFSVGDGEVPVSLPVEADGSFTFDFSFPFVLGNSPGVTFAGVDGAGVALVPVELTVNLPAPIAAPVIVSPTNNSTVTGTTLTVRGTGIPGVSVVVLILPDDDATLAAAAAVDPADFTPTTVVGPTGAWSVSATLPLGTYRAAAFHTTTPPSAPDAALLSESSNEVVFTVAAAAVVRPAVLAATGPTSTALAFPAGGLVLAGAALLGASRRRRALDRIAETTGAGTVR